MKVWTIQHINVYKTLQKEGVYTTNEKFICDESFKDAYQWLFDEAKKDIKGWKSNRPVWCWDYRPDLRTHRHIMNPDEPLTSIPHVLLEIEVDEKKLLRTDFEEWHMVLNGSFFSKDESLYDDFYLRLPSSLRLESYSSWPKKFQKELFKSWESIKRTGPIKGEIHQLIKEDLKFSEVVSVKFFEMKNRRPKK